jgi:hypothetical protein
MKIASGFRSFILLSCSVAHAATAVVDRAQVPTGILYDLTAQLAHIERFDGRPVAPRRAPRCCDRPRSSCDKRHSMRRPAWPSDERLRDNGSLTVRIGLIDALLSLRDRCREA